MEPIVFNVRLSLETVDQVLIAHLVFTNHTSKPIPLDKFTICLDGKFTNNVFEITDSRGKEVSYYGIMVNRLIREEDFMEFKPGGVVKVTVKLNDAYRLVLGNKYSIRYYAFNPCLYKKAPLMEMVSNTVHIHYQ